MLLAFISCSSFLPVTRVSLVRHEQRRLRRRRIICNTLRPDRTTQFEPNTTNPPPKPRLTRYTAAATFALYTYSTFSFTNGANVDGVNSLLVGLREALELSLNFAFVTPVVFPTLAPTYAPTYEALFNLVVAWAFLFLGFVSEDLSKRQIVPYSIVAKLILFITNFVYLPFLVIRRPNPYLVQNPVADPSPLLRVSESEWLPIGVTILAITSLAWALFGRDIGGDAGDVITRFKQFQILLNSNILAHSLGLDCAVLALLQSALVNDDVKRRAWKGSDCDNAVAAARFVPLFGLAYYLWCRATHASLIRR